MKKTIQILLLCFILGAIIHSCKDEAALTEEEGAVDVNSTNARIGANGNYKIDFEVTSGTNWKYTITKEGGKDLGHFILDFGNCGEESPTIDNIVSVKVNGVDWSGRIESSEGNTGCEMTSDNFVKFDDLVKANKHVIEFTLDTLYSQVLTTAWLKAGRDCRTQTVSGPGCRGYTLTTTMEADASLTGKSYNEINNYMKAFGFDYSEHPNCNGGYGGHMNGTHVSIAGDAMCHKPAFQFDIHIDSVIDGDRCSATTVDRQRNEMKSITNNTTWAKVQGNYGEWQVLEWKFKLPVGFQPTPSFCHIHQLKAQDGPNNSSPIITLTPRANADGSNRRLQIIHTIDGATTDKGTMVNNLPLSALEGEWVQVREEMHYTHSGYYSCKITRVSDGQVILDFKDTNIDLWPSGTSYVRHKYGIYRSLGNGRLNQNPVGQNPLLKNESLLITDFRVYEKNTNPAPGVPHD
jgi:hypothetical protein